MTSNRPHTPRTHHPIKRFISSQFPIFLLSEKEISCGDENKEKRESIDGSLKKNDGMRRGDPF